MNLMVTRGGIPQPDQPLAVRLFKDAAGTKERYRLVFDRAQRRWRLFHCGREVTGDNKAGPLPLTSQRRMPGVILDWIKAARA